MQGKTTENRTYCHQLKSLSVGEQAHNLKVVGSNPTPATNNINVLAALTGAAFCLDCHLGANYFGVRQVLAKRTLVLLNGEEGLWTPRAMPTRRPGGKV